VNKKKQKNFICFSSGMFQRRAKRSRSFLVTFFQKSNCFLVASRKAWMPAFAGMTVGCGGLGYL
jgi:hypothetical protein